MGFLRPHILRVWFGVGQGLSASSCLQANPQPASCLLPHTTAHSPHPCLFAAHSALHHLAREGHPCANWAHYLFNSKQLRWAAQGPAGPAQDNLGDTHQGAPKRAVAGPEAERDQPLFLSLGAVLTVPVPTLNLGQLNSGSFLQSM